MVTMSHPPTVEILIVNYNTAKLVAACLQSILAHLPRPDLAAVQVAVFDNASSDGSTKMVASRFPLVRMVESSENIGFARASNQLASTSTADYLLLLNSDVVFTEDAIVPMLRVLEAYPEVKLVGPRLVYPDGTPQYSSERFPDLRFELARMLSGTKLDRVIRGGFERRVRRYRNVAEIDARVTHRTDFLWATCWLLRRGDIEPAGLFDDYFVTYDEDLDFCTRLRQQQGEIVYLASCQVVHLGGASSTTEAKQRLMLQARGKYYRRSYGPTHELLYRCASRVITDAKRCLARAKFLMKGLARTRAHDFG